MGSESSKCDCDALESKLNACMNPAGLENRILVGEAFKQWKAVSDCFKDNYKRGRKNLGLYYRVSEMLLKTLQPLIQQKYVSDEDVNIAAGEIDIIISQLIAAEIASQNEDDAAAEIASQNEDDAAAETAPKPGLSCEFPKTNMLAPNQSRIASK